jgi:hypothetical protein
MPPGNLEHDDSVTKLSRDDLELILCWPNTPVLHPRSARVGQGGRRKILSALLIPESCRVEATKVNPLMPFFAVCGSIHSLVYGWMARAAYKT